MAKKLDEMGFKSSVADPDVWLRPPSNQMAKNATDTSWWLHVNDMLTMSMEPMSIMLEMQGMVKFKNDKIEEPSNYLGAKWQRKNKNGIECCSSISADFIKAVDENVEQGIKIASWKLQSRVQTPMSSSYLP
jgi:hypothetical protein